MRWIKSFREMNVYTACRLTAIGCAAGAAFAFAAVLFGGAGSVGRFLVADAMVSYQEVYAYGDYADVSVGELAGDIGLLSQNVGDERSLATLAEGGYADVVGVGAMTLYEPETEGLIGEHVHDPSVIAPFADGWQDDLGFLRQHFYSVNDKLTDMTEADFSARDFLAEDFTVTPSLTADEPKVLIFHTHMYEGYADSDEDDIRDGVFGVGERLADALREKYGLHTLHYGGRFDLVDGAVNIKDAYERMAPVIKRILEQYPSIEVVIDMHRDGLPDGMRVAYSDGGVKRAQVMFVNGLSKIKDGGRLKPIESLPNPYLKDNLAFSFQAQIAANELYPGMMRRIYLNAYRYSLFMSPASLLIEVGAQTNTMEEAFNCAEPLADIIAKVIIAND